MTRGGPVAHLVLASCQLHLVCLVPSLSLESIVPSACRACLRVCQGCCPLLFFKSGHPAICLANASAYHDSC